MSRRVAVIGAGPMGLAVAYQLARDGWSPVIYEADDRIGGMTATFDFGGLKIERYYHFHCTSDSDFLEILGQLGISDKMCWRETKMAYWYLGRLQPWGNPFALLNFKGLSLIAKFRYGFHVFLCTKRHDWRSLDGVNALEWIKKWAGEEAYNVLWKNLFDYKFYNYSDNLSAAWIWSRIRRIGRSRYNIFKEKLGYLEGGSDTLLSALERDIIHHGGEIKLNSPVQEVVIENDRIIGVKCRNNFEKFSKVISTIPLPFVSKIFPSLPDHILNKFTSKKNIAVVCLIVKLRKKISENFWLNINDPEMDIPGLVEYSNLRPLNDHIVYIPYYMPGEHVKYLQPDDVFIAKVRSFIKKINPEIDETDIIDIKVSRYRFAQPICPPNYLSSLPKVDLPIEGLCVADTSYYYPEDRGISESIGFGRKLAQMIK